MFPPRCAKSIFGDIQLEAVLTPLLLPRFKPEIFSHTPHDTQPDLFILDIGCAWGRLLGGLTAFPGYVTAHLHYTGCEASPELVQQSYEFIHELEPRILNGGRFIDRLAEVKITTWEELRKGPQAFDFVYLVNVLHHVEPSDIPNLVADVLAVTKDNGYVIIHDFFFGNQTEAFDFTKYCEDSVFFGPNHVSSFFALASTQSGLYRTFRRPSPDGNPYNLFTLILHIANELSREAYEKSVWYDDYFSYYDTIPGIDASSYAFEPGS